MKQNVYDGVGSEQALKSGERPQLGVVLTGAVKSSDKPHHSGFRRRRTPRLDLLPRPALAAAVMLAALHVSGTASAQLLLTVDHGASWDPLVGANPMFNFPGEIRSTTVSVSEAPFVSGGAQFTGPVRLSAECCKDALTRNPIAPAGLSVEVTCEFLGRIEAPAPRTDIVRPPGRPDLPTRQPPCEAATGAATVNISSAGTMASAVFRVTTGPSATPGTFIATIKGDSSLGVTSKEVFVSVVASALPPNGPFPGCVATSTPIGGVSPIPLASITPDPFAWKRATPANLARTTYSIGLGISSTAGLTVGFSGLGSTGPVPSTVSTISFTNAVGVGWPVAVRTVDSRNCAAPTQTFSVAAGETKSFSLNSASTTTLVFSKSTCRAFINLGDCWARTALGLDDIAVFSVGPFWTLFGGRMVSLSTVGDWGKIPVPNSVATIRTQ